MAEEIALRILKDAGDWAVENGLKRPLEGGIRMTDWGFIVDVEELSTGRIASCCYQRDGSRSMYTLDRGGIR